MWCNVPKEFINDVHSVNLRVQGKQFQSILFLVILHTLLLLLLLHRLICSLLEAQRRWWSHYFPF